MIYHYAMLTAVFCAAASLPLAYLSAVLPLDIWARPVVTVTAIAPSQPLTIAAWAARTRPDPEQLRPWYPPEEIGPRIAAGREIIVIPFEPAIALPAVMQWDEIDPAQEAETWDQMVLELTGKASCWAAA